ncbi:pentatricopeptide repeat-containing protein At4g02750-like [Cryptomeria japonica]|uniref:pentatricopeptide repeat-containing protein At4g02750-like n=1 Tax=Cryptomeria japonica TaxID=3369 RepID=UPI0025ACAB29|nr:pentatricopeptide repeat-containing protein At4g02750-like [Cryptomeria japonica]
MTVILMKTSPIIYRTRLFTVLKGCHTFFGTFLACKKQLQREFCAGQRVKFDSKYFCRRSHVVSWNAIITKYVNVGQLEDARQVFDKMLQRDVISWTAMIAGYAKNGRMEEACQMFDKMPERDIVVWNAMLAGYVQNGRLDDAHVLFRRMPKKNASSWTTMITGCFGNGRVDDARQLFDKMTQRDVVSWTAMVTGYVQNGRLEEARQVFDKMPQRNVVSWTAMIAGYAQNGQFEALKLFSEMRRSGVKPNESTFSAVLNVCARLAAMEFGKEIHAHIAKTGYESNVFVGNALTNMYAMCCSNDAETVFDQMPERDIVSCNAMIAFYFKSRRIDDASLLFDRLKEPDVFSWTTMISGYTQNGYYEEALKLFIEMQLSETKPNESTLTSILSACASIVALGQGQKVHSHIIKREFQHNLCVGNSLITMYAKCGSVDGASQIFKQMNEKDVVSWTAIISGYAQHGCSMEAIHLFEQMQLCGMKPNEITFIGVLTACSHTGLVDEGLRYFDSMSHDHSITPTVDHYSCMVDLLGRSGQLTKAEEFISKMPYEPDTVVWNALLAGCRIHGNIEIGKRVADLLIELEPQNMTPYVMLANIYAANSQWEDASRLKRMMEDTGAKKNPGCSWIEVKNSVHTFVAGDRSHPETERLYAALDSLFAQMKAAGYVPNTNFVLHVGDDEQ